MADSSGSSGVSATPDGGPVPDTPAISLDSLTTRVDAPVVGLGEATHGSREFVQLRGESTTRLCRDGDAVALEAGAGAVVALDDYVAGDAGLADALAAMPAFWQTRSFAAVCRQLRELAADGTRLRVYGVDVDDPGVLARAIGKTGFADDPPPALDALADDPGSLSGRVPDERIERAERALAAVRDSPETERTTNDRLVHLTDALAWTVEWLRAGGATATFEPTAMGDRDRVMAANTASLADRHDRTVLWAHSVHVQRGTFDNRTTWSDQRTTGDHLDARLGNDYCPVGTDFAVGGFRAGTPESDGLVAHRVDEPLPGTVAARIDGPAAVDPADSAGSPRLVRAVGLTVDHENGPPVVDTDLGVAFDHVAAFDAVSATRPFGSD